jgi:hypothetical protein
MAMIASSTRGSSSQTYCWPDGKTSAKVPVLTCTSLSLTPSEVTALIEVGAGAERGGIPRDLSPGQLREICGVQPGDEGVFWQLKQPRALQITSRSASERDREGAGAVGWSVTRADPIFSATIEFQVEDIRPMRLSTFKFA